MGSVLRFAAPWSISPPGGCARDLPETHGHELRGGQRMTRVRAQRGVLEVAGGASPREVSWIAAKKIGDTWGWDTLRAFQQREYENLRKLGQGSAGP